MDKWLVFSLHGTQYAVPASIVAKNYAEYYEDTDRGTYEELYNEILSNDDELIDWANGDMVDDDFNGSYILVRKDIPSFSSAFYDINNYVEVVTGDPRCATR